jgi:hypothetical protein
MELTFEKKGKRAINSPYADITSRRKTNREKGGYF